VRRPASSRPEAVARQARRTSLRAELYDETKIPFAQDGINLADDAGLAADQYVVADFKRLLRVEVTGGEDLIAAA